MVTHIVLWNLKDKTQKAQQMMGFVSCSAGKLKGARHIRISQMLHQSALHSAGKPLHNGPVHSLSLIRLPGGKRQTELFKALFSKPSAKSARHLFGLFHIRDHLPVIGKQAELPIFSRLDHRMGRIAFSLICLIDSRKNSFLRILTDKDLIPFHFHASFPARNSRRQTEKAACR